ncbi:hypothetical protein D3C74_334100 [compost metagenome]
MAAEDASPTVAPRVRRRASWGAASEMNAMGPAAAVTSAVRATPTTTSESRVRSERTPRACAASSPISRTFMRRPRRNSGGTRTARISTTGRTWVHDSPLRLPAPQVAAAMARESSALRMSHVLTDASIALIAMPTMMSRKPWTPFLYASR